jgi:hypothetical protein
MIRMGKTRALAIICALVAVFGLVFGEGAGAATKKKRTSGTGRKRSGGTGRKRSSGSNRKRSGGTKKNKAKDVQAEDTAAENSSASADGDDLKSKIAELQKQIDGIKNKPAADAGSFVSKADVEAMQRSFAKRLSCPTLPTNSASAINACLDASSKDKWKLVHSLATPGTKAAGEVIVEPGTYRFDARCENEASSIVMNVTETSALFLGVCKEGTSVGWGVPANKSSVSYSSGVAITMTSRQYLNDSTARKLNIGIVNTRAIGGTYQVGVTTPGISASDIQLNGAQSFVAVYRYED